jgi:two-component system sensor histidine kinase HydH
MRLRLGSVPGYTPALLAMLLPAVLIYSSLRTFRELDQMKSVYLRNRSAAIAARLETGTSAEQVQQLLDDEPGLIGLEILSSPNDPSLLPLWEGRELFRTESVREAGRQIYRAYVPFHAEGMLRIARIDLDSAAGNFLLVHARHNVVTASISGAALLLLAGYAIWSIRRSAAEEKRRLELAHLAHLGTMAAMLAHEIRTPLATIKGFTQLALEQSEKRLSSVLEPVVNETQRLERLVNDLLLYGRPPQPLLRDCSWAEIAARIQGGAPERVTIQPADLELRTDPDLLGQVLSNLVRNATEAVGESAEGGVRLDIHAADQTVVIGVEDNGPGIPGEARDKVLESFFTTKPFGTGLGLPIARKLTTSLGGQLVLQSREGRGLRVEIRLPAQLPTPVRAEVRV